PELQETLTPVYPTTEGIKQATLRKLTDQALELLETCAISELLPPELAQGMMSLPEALRTLHRQLKQQTGLTPQRYLNRVRLMKARHLLRHSDESVTDIAYRCGFGDSNHFSTLFRREFDWSPRDIRQGRDAILQ
ncbi:helix-turn-helix domain-containing protein, partial [Pseudomonas aeruginosa]|nr:helix-turn-helix domain-containing protein [Pseudomonas aeruginosa]